MGWTEENVGITVDVVVYKDVKCDRCQRELELVHTTSRSQVKPCLQYNDALIVKLIGGYGMYFDDYPPLERDKAIFCKDCADYLFEMFPVFKEMTTHIDEGLLL